MTLNLTIVPTTYPLIYRTYSRRINNQQENLQQIWDRVYKGLCKIGNFNHSQEFLIKDYFYNGYSYPSGRYMWVGGTQWSEKPENYAGLYNCFSAIIKDWEDIRLAFQLLMEGCGVGSTFELADIEKLNEKYKYNNISDTNFTYEITEIGKRYNNPDTQSIQSDTSIITEVSNTSCTFLESESGNTLDIVVGDSRQGWAKSIKDLLEYTVSSKEYPPIEKIIINLEYVRPQGVPIKGFGGISNPSYLTNLFTNVIELIKKYKNKKIDAFFLEKIRDEIALATVSGNVRRSACITQFSHNDEIAKSLKQNLWQQDSNGNWRIDPERDCFRMANHTQVFHKLPNYEDWFHSLTNQYNTGEGALQFAPMAVYRCNLDILQEDEKDFCKHLLANNKISSFYQFLQDIMNVKNVDKKEQDFRLRSYLLNPCITGDSYVSTTEGLCTVESLLGVPFTAIVHGKEYKSTDYGFWFSGYKKVYKLETKLGKSLKTTPDHKVLVYRQITTYTQEQKKVNQWVEMKNIRVGDLVVVNDIFEKYDEVIRIYDTEKIEAVYDCTIPELNAFSANGIIVHNCAEVISGHSFLCNLSEVHLNLLADKSDKVVDDAFRACALIASSLLHHNFVDKQLQFAREIDPIIGVSFTGLFDFFVQKYGCRYLIWWHLGRPSDKYFEESEIKYLQRWKNVVKETVDNYCKEHNLKIPRRYTLVKPAGSLSLISGASNGWHPQKYWQYIRRMTFAKNDPVALTCMKMGYNIVPSQSCKDETGKLLDDPFDPNVHEWLVEIPVRVPYYDLVKYTDEVIGKKTDPNNYSAISQLKFYHLVQKYYSTHTTSATIEFRQKEIEEMANYMVQNQIDMEYISFATLPRFESNFAYPRLPFEPISDEEYETRMKSINTNFDFYNALCYYNELNNTYFNRGSSGCDSVKCII